MCTSRTLIIATVDTATLGDDMVEFVVGCVVFCWLSQRSPGKYADGDCDFQMWTWMGPLGCQRLEKEPGRLLQSRVSLALPAVITRATIFEDL